MRLLCDAFLECRREEPGRESLGSARAEGAKEDIDEGVAALEGLERSGMKRCEWSALGALEQDYHDTEWGVPVHDDRTLFEFLILEGAQAGLSWSTILRKRTGYRQAMDHFEPERIAGYSVEKIQELLTNPGIIRNRLKIESAVTNARAFLKVQEQFESFDAYLWRFVRGRPIQNRWQKLSEVPGNSPESAALSKDLKGHGFTFVGPIICYAFMQAVGMVNDHVMDCFRYEEVRRLAACR